MRMSIFKEEGIGRSSPSLSIDADYLPMRGSVLSALRCRLRFGFLMRSSLQSVSVLGLGDMPCLKDTCRERAIQFNWSFNAFSATPLMSLNFFNSEDSGEPQSTTFTRDLSSGKRPWTWTDSLISANILGIVALVRGGGWGYLHFTCYTLSNIGPVIEEIWGPRRYLTLYISSAVAGSTMSYFINKRHFVCAPAAISGLVGSYFVYLLRLRNRDRIQESNDKYFKYVDKVIVLNLAFAATYPAIYNFALLGGIIGGAAISCLVDPEWKLKPIIHDKIREVSKVVEVNRE